MFTLNADKLTHNYINVLIKCFIIGFIVIVSEKHRSEFALTLNFSLKNNL